MHFASSIFRLYRVKAKYHSGCPIAFALDLIGDRWSLLVLRDIMLWDKQYYDEFVGSAEGISTNILADRLKQLEADGLVSRRQDDNNRRKFIYRPTEKAMDLLPMLLEMAVWGARYDKNTAAPPEVIAHIRNDREGFIAGVRKKFIAKSS